MTNRLNPPPPRLDAADSHSEAAAKRALAAALTPVMPTAERAAVMRGRLLERARAASEESRGIVTVRRATGAWSQVVKGVRMKLLHDGAARSVLLELEPGATVPRHRHHENEECIVLQGDAQLGNLHVAQGDYHLAFSGSLHGRVSSQGGALLYLRGVPLGSTADAARDLITAWLPGKGSSPITVRAAEGAWHDVLAGVQAKSLWGNDTERSVLLRIEPGASLPLRARAPGEERLVIDGEAFVGDTLLRAGEYQCTLTDAPQREVYSDVGALMFMRGGESAVAARLSDATSSRPAD